MFRKALPLCFQECFKKGLFGYWMLSTALPSVSKSVISRYPVLSIALLDVTQRYPVLSSALLSVINRVTQCFQKRYLTQTLAQSNPELKKQRPERRHVKDVYKFLRKCCVIRCQRGEPAAPLKPDRETLTCCAKCLYESTQV